MHQVGSMSTMKSDEIYISDEDDGDNVELTEWDKALILRLATCEYFAGTQELESSRSVYKCMQNCKVCLENKPHFPIDETLIDKLFVEGVKGEFLSKEDREAINKDLVHDFFKQKWESNNRKIKIAHIKKEKIEDLESLGEYQSSKNISKVHAVKTQRNTEFNISENGGGSCKSTGGYDTNTVLLNTKKENDMHDTSVQSTQKINKDRIMESDSVKKIKTALKEQLRLDTNSQIHNNLTFENEEDDCYDVRYKDKVKENDTNHKGHGKIKRVEAAQDNYNNEKQSNHYNRATPSTSYNLKQDNTKIERNQSKGQNNCSRHSNKKYESDDESDGKIYSDGEPPARNKTQTLNKQTRRNQSSGENKEDECYDVRYKYKTSKGDTKYSKTNRFEKMEAARDFNKNEKRNSYECNRISPSTSYSSKRDETPPRTGRDSKGPRSLKSSIQKSNNLESDESEGGTYSEEGSERYDQPARNKTKALNRRNRGKFLPPNCFEKRPMDDPSSKFYIDRKWIDVKMYEKGLKYEKWNPTQSLYEIGTKCCWTRPEYVVTRVSAKNNTPRFMCEGVVNGETFTTDHTVTQKKLAQHLASTKILNYIGFDFKCPNFKQPPLADFAPKPLPAPSTNRVAKFSLQMSSASWSLEEVGEYPSSPKRSKM